MADGNFPLTSDQPHGWCEINFYPIWVFTYLYVEVLEIIFIIIFTFSGVALVFLHSNFYFLLSVPSSRGNTYRR